MPSRLVSLAILVYWCIAAFCLLTWEVLPELTLGIPSRLARHRRGRRFGKAGELEHSGHRRSQVARRPAHGRRGGHCSKRLPDGWFELTQPGQLRRRRGAQGNAAGNHGRASAWSSSSVYRVDPSGNLRSFDMKVTRRVDSGEYSVHGQGPAQEGVMEVVSEGAVADLEPEVSFAYEPRSVVQMRSGRSTGCRACTWASGGTRGWSTRSRGRSSRCASRCSGGR